MKRLTLPPYGKRLQVSQTISLVMIYIGTPYGWNAVKRDQQEGIFNGLVLPRIGEVNKYIWPVANCNIVAIDYTIASPEESLVFIKAMAKSGAKAMAFRQFPEQAVFEYDFDQGIA